jgi:AraC-like DNA-binding protein
MTRSPRSVVRRASLPLRSRTPLPRAVIAFGIPAAARTVTRDVVGHGAVRDVSRAEEVEDALQHAVDACVLCVVPSDSAAPMLHELLRLRRRFPNVPAVALYYPSSSSCHAVLQLGAVGVTQIVTAEPSIQPVDLQTAFTRCHSDGVAIRIWKRCEFALPDNMVTLLKAAIRLAHEPISGERLASAAGMPERSLRKYCTQEALLSPQWIVGWARLLVAGFYLDEPARTVASVAELLAFPSACALRNQLKRYSNLASRQLRAGGTTMSLARALEHAVRAHEAAELSRFRSD